MGASFSTGQFFPPTPTLTESNLPRQEGKVFLITGGTAGVGYELCRMLYQSGAKVYLAGRSQKNAHDAISKIKALPCTSSPGELHFLHVDLSDLTTIKPAAETFISKEQRLDVLVNNAGVSNPPKGSKTVQGYELQLGTNCLGPYLFTQLLRPILLSTSRNAEPGDTRVVWTSSIACEFTPTGGGLDPSSLSNMLNVHPQTAYTLSKTGNWFLAQSLSDQVSKDGILSITQNPGNLKTQLTRHMSAIVPYIVAPLLHEAKYGAYTELYCAVSEELGIGDGGAYILPWGRKHPKPRADLVEALRKEDEGGAQWFAEWCEKEVAAYR